jgi:DNA-binding transcriptional ArsR family regulator
MAVAGFVVSLVSLLVAGSAAFFAYKQVRAARDANALPVVLGLLGEFEKTRAERYFVVNDLGRYPTELGVWGLPDEAREKVLRVLHYIDHLGLLVHRNLADDEAIAGFVGGAVIALWKALAPYVEAEREKRRRERDRVDAGYQEYFEDLAARMVELDPPTIRSHLRSFASR